MYVKLLITTRVREVIGGSFERQITYPAGERGESVKRLYYLSSDLDEIEQVEQELEKQGITGPQLHVLSEDDSEVARHHVHDISDFMKLDVVRSTFVGTVVGLFISFLLLLSVYISGVSTSLTWAPFVFLAFVILGFCAWEGGLYGIQIRNRSLKRFEEDLHHGSHLLFIDVTRQQENIVEAVVEKHPTLLLASEGESLPEWAISAQNKWNAFVRAMP